MNNWPHQPIASLGTVITGSTPKTSEERFYGGDTPFVTPAELDQNEPIISASRTLSEAGSQETRLLPEGTVMVCCIGSLGKVGIAGRTVATNQQINSVIFNPEIIWPRFGFYACRLLKTRLETLAPATTVAIVSKSKFEQLEIPVPPLEEQKRIANILDRAETMRAKRRAALAQLDELVQSIFIKMFGDPVKNPKGWSKQPFGEVCISRLGKMLDQKQQTGKHLRPYLRNANVQWFHFDLTEIFNMDFNEAAREEFRLKYGDLLICEGGEPGRAAIWKGELDECYYQKALHCARPHKDLANSEYLAWLLWFLAARGGLGDHVTAATIAHLTGEKLKAMKIPLPPLDLQKEFSHQVAAIEKLKITHKASLAEMDELFASLQYRAFRGEL